MPQTRTEMTLVGFVQAQNCSNYAASWRHPEADHQFLTAGYYQRIARALEKGKFQLLFFDDRLALPDIYQGSHVEAVRNGVRVVKLDPLTVLSMLAGVTDHIGLGATMSTTYYPPYHVARAFATLDHMSNGRAAWNVVTSLNDSEAFNMGAAGSVDHDTRYDRADEFVQVVLDHWGCWAPDALVLDRETGVFADGSKVSRIDHAGPYLKSRGPFTVPPTPQQHPVLIQAGQSGRGREFAVRWGEVVFAIFPNLDVGRQVYAGIHEEAVRQGRDPRSFHIAPLVYPIVGRTQAEAEDKAALIESLAEPIDGLALLSEALNFDFGSKGPDEPFTDDELASISGLRSIRDRVIRLSGNPNPTVEEFVRFSARGTIREAPNFVGAPSQVADQLEEWFQAPACDGFVVAASHVPGAYEDFSELVVPELQKRGIFQTDYTAASLRDSLGFSGYRAI
ncbi:MAG: LLM class flavin-dependent oxidoreductase [Pseudomonadota bacterium]